MMAKAARRAICGGKDQLNDVITLGVFPTGSAVAVETAAVKAAASWLAGNVPLLAFVSPAVLVAFTVFLIGYGLKRFCNSTKLKTLFAWDKREE